MSSKQSKNIPKAETWGSTTQMHRPAHMHTPTGSTPTARVRASTLHTRIVVVEKNAETWVLHCLARLWPGGKRSHGCSPEFAPRTRATEPDRDPHSHRRAQAGPLGAPQSRAREKTRGRNRKGARCAKKSIWYRDIVLLYCNTPYKHKHTALASCLDFHQVQVI